MGVGGKKKFGGTWVSEFTVTQQLNILGLMPIVVHVRVFFTERSHD